MLSKHEFEEAFEHCRQFNCSSREDGTNDKIIEHDQDQRDRILLLENILHPLLKAAEAMDQITEAEFGPGDYAPLFKRAHEALDVE